MRLLPFFHLSLLSISFYPSSISLFGLHGEGDGKDISMFAVRFLLSMRQNNYVLSSNVSAVTHSCSVVVGLIARASGVEPASLASVLALDSWNVAFSAWLALATLWAGTWWIGSIHVGLWHTPSHGVMVGMGLWLGIVGGGDISLSKAMIHMSFI